MTALRRLWRHPDPDPAQQMRRYRRWCEEQARRDDEEGM